MSDLQRYRNLYKSTFSVEDESLNENFKYQSHPHWDSLGHMSLIAAIESEFGINMDMDDVIDFDSYNKGIEILEKYSINLNKG